MITFRLEFEPRDLWIGVHWKYRPLAYEAGGVKLSASDRATYDQAAAGIGKASSLPRPRFDLWLCLLPCVPLHVTWWGKEAKSPENASWIVIGGQKPDHPSSVAKTDIDHG